MHASFYHDERTRNFSLGIDFQHALQFFVRSRSVEGLTRNNMTPFPRRWTKTSPPKFFSRVTKILFSCAARASNAVSEARDSPISAAATRSEERRVGEECRSRWSPDH